MISNASLNQLADMLKSAQTILIFTHTNIDGDALGSAAALCRVLRSLGKEAWILMDEDVPEYISFMDTEFCTDDKDCLKNQDVSVCVDCGEYSRFKTLADKFEEGGLKLCIDHHATGEGFGDYYYIDETAAATTELIYMLITEMGAGIDKTIAESLYTGITTDSGSFQYSNTTSRTHAITADLLSKGVDHVAIAIKLYQTIPLSKLMIQARIVQRAELLCDGKVAVSYVTEDMLKEASAVIDDAEGSVDMLRNIDGVEMAAFLKEKDGVVKVSLRAKSYASVNEIAETFGGGGHVKAAGCTLDMSMEEAVEALKRKIKDYWENYAG